MYLLMLLLHDVCGRTYVLACFLKSVHNKMDAGIWSAQVTLNWGGREIVL